MLAMLKIGIVEDLRYTPAKPRKYSTFQDKNRRCFEFLG